jgi:fatty acid desaturase
VRDFAVGYLMLGATAALIVAADSALESLRILWVVAGAWLIGFWMAYIQLFLHEAAHFNFCQDRRWNDRLANLLIGVWVATDIREYRRIHWDHHRFLGQPTDTERSYFQALGWRFLLESLLLVGAIRVLRHRREKIRLKTTANLSGGDTGTAMLASALFVHLLVFCVCVWQGQIALALAWLAGNLMVYPLFGALRQLLEHRDTAASMDVDYSVHPHGKFTRSFKAGPLGNFLGGAGFRWHDIHHFDPELSYTNLSQVDAFLGTCVAAASARTERHSYGQVARQLWPRG